MLANTWFETLKPRGTADSAVCTDTRTEEDDDTSRLGGICAAHGADYLVLVPAGIAKVMHI